MKKLLFLLAFSGALLTGCDKKDKVVTDGGTETSKQKFKIQYEKDSVKTTKFVEPEVFTDSLFQNTALLIAALNKLPLSEMNLVLATHYKSVVCDDSLRALSEYRHNIEDEAFFRYLARRHPDNTTTSGIVFYTDTWANVLDYIRVNKIKCFDGWLGIDYSNGVIAYYRSNKFDNSRSMYSENLFKGIEAKLLKSGYVPFEVWFTTAVCTTLQEGDYNDLNKVIFKVRSKNSANEERFDYYDMSDDPL